MNFNRVIVIEALVGSHNYNLNTPSSDEDWKFFVRPTFDDLYSGKMYSNGAQTSDYDYTAHDIRKLADLLAKSNPNFLEVLFSVRVIAHPNFVWLIDNAERISRSNPKALWFAIIGSHLQKMATLKKGTATTQDLVNKFGYDTKDATHAMRLLFTAQRFIESGSMAKALWYKDNDPQRQILLDLKAGLYSEADFRAMVHDWRGKNEADYKDAFANMTPDFEVYDVIRGIVKRHIKQNLFS